MLFCLDSTRQHASTWITRQNFALSTCLKKLLTNLTVVLLYADRVMKSSPKLELSYLSCNDVQSFPFLVYLQNYALYGWWWRTSLPIKNRIFCKPGFWLYQNWPSCVHDFWLKKVAKNRHENKIWSQHMRRDNNDDDILGDNIVLWIKRGNSWRLKKNAKGRFWSYTFPAS